jgi:hypothetical protein
MPEANSPAPQVFSAANRAFTKEKLSHIDPPYENMSPSANCQRAVPQDGMNLQWMDMQ